jgi:ABC-type transport system involved in multi-copper enzyme maturation permease subunit
VGSLGIVFKISSLRTIGEVSRYIFPTDGLWRGAIYYLEPQSFVTHQLAASTQASGSPFFADTPPSWPYLTWVGVWFIAAIVLGLWSFNRREL